MNATRILLPGGPPPITAVADDVAWDARARALYGMRFGWKAMAGVAAVILAAFALVDAGFFVFAWLTLPRRLDAAALVAIDGAGDAIDVAPAQPRAVDDAVGARVTRFFVCSLGWALVLVLRSVRVDAVALGPAAAARRLRHRRRLGRRQPVRRATNGFDAAAPLVADRVAGVAVVAAESRA